jgi:predicted O-methyltransferase YrrM
MELPLNPIRQAVIERIWRGKDPLHAFPVNLFEYDVEGWNSQHRFLEDGIVTLRPSIVVEIGVWKGASTIFMADRMRTVELPSIVIAVDTWLGSSEHWLVDDYFGRMSFLHGYPALYHKFASNIVRAGLADFAVPLPIDSLNASKVLPAVGIAPTMIHLDGAHDYESVTMDLKVWWKLLTPGGLLVGDDYFVDGTWPTVRQAFDDFFGALGIQPLEHESGKCRIRKPVS